MWLRPRCPTVLDTFSPRSCQFRTGPIRNYATRNVRSQRSTKRPATLIAVAGGGLAASSLFLADEVKYGYGAVERSSRVLSTLIVCINE